MSKIIRMTPEMIEASKRKFEQRLRSMNVTNGSISYSETFAPTNKKAVVWFTPEAYIKMVALLQDSEKEVAWHGVAYRLEEDGHYLISDILVYPQEVTGATVNTDQAEYETWLMEKEDDVFNNIRMQGHSHVRMDTHPSPTDLGHQEKIVQQLEDDMFYIFMIWNKYLKYTAKIYDLKLNTLFEPGDVDLAMVGAPVTLDDFLKDARAMVKTKTYQPQNSYQGGNYNGGYQGNYQGGYQNGYQGSYNKPATTTPAAQSAQNKTEPPKEEKKDVPAIPTRPKPCIGNGWRGAAASDYDEDDYDNNPHGSLCH